VRVKILESVEYEPVSGDARSCFGSLLKRPSKVPNGTRTVTATDGTESEVPVFAVGPMVHYFPKGRSPELRDEIAAEFIARGVATPFDGEPVRDITDNERLLGITVENGVIVQ